MSDCWRAAKPSQTWGISSEKINSLALAQTTNNIVGLIIIIVNLINFSQPQVLF